MIGWLVVALLAADPTPAPAPKGLPPGAVRVHLRAHEDLDSDHLRLLSRPGVVLWLSTRSNTLRDSTLETLRAFEQVWVELRAPWRPSDLAQLERLPKAGLWLRVEGAVPKLARPPRPIAVALRGPLGPELEASLATLRPAWLEWRAGAELDLMQWARFRQLPGRKLLERLPGEPTLQPCPDVPGPNEPALEVKVASVEAFSAETFPCGRGPLLQLEPETSPAVVQSLLVKSPSAELSIAVGADQRRSVATRKLLDQLGVPPRR